MNEISGCVCRFDTPKIVSCLDWQGNERSCQFLFTCISIVAVHLYIVE